MKEEAWRDDSYDTKNSVLILTSDKIFIGSMLFSVYGVHYLLHGNSSRHVAM